MRRILVSTITAAIVLVSASAYAATEQEQQACYEEIARDVILDTTIAAPMLAAWVAKTLKPEDLSNDGQRFTFGWFASFSKSGVLPDGPPPQTPSPGLWAGSRSIMAIRRTAPSRAREARTQGID